VSDGILSLCSGYGGLDITVQALTGGHLVAYAENYGPAARVMEHHNPGVPNLGDITQTDWSQWTGKAQIVAAGWPCQDISDAGKRAGISGSRSGIWKNVAEAVRVIRPGLVFLENVAAVRSRGLDVVAHDLDAIGYRLTWVCVRASAVGAPHPRYRFFGLGRPHRFHADTQGI
jgi:DNA (cytosine-5)-methyltransferase 1